MKTGPTIVTLVFRLVLAAVFVAAAIPKIQDPIAFSKSIEGYQTIGGQFALWAALILPWLEIVVALGLFVPFLRRASGLIICALLFIFIGLHASAWFRGLDISCGCFGSSESSQAPNYLLLIGRNLGLLFMAVFVTFSDLRNFSRKHSSKA